MTEDENTAPVEAPAWESARTVWSVGGVDLPATMNSNNAHFLADLKRAAANLLPSSTLLAPPLQRNGGASNGWLRGHDHNDFVHKYPLLANSRH